MPFKNRVRLPIKLTRPSWPTQREIQSLANGEEKQLSVKIQKNYAAETDYMDEKMIEKLTIAINHDEVNIEGEKYLGRIVATTDVEAAWITFLDYPRAKASFTARVTPFEATNSNCMTCEEAQQILLQDYTIDLEYGDPATAIDLIPFNVICCYPATFSLVFYNTAYLDGIPTINANNILTIKPALDGTDTNGVKIVTYRVECPDGSYDEGDVFANFTGGTEADCLAPTNLQITDITTNSITISFTPPVPQPGFSYSYEIRLASNNALLATTGGPPTATTFTTAGVLTLNPGTEYIIRVKSICQLSPLLESNFASINATTEVAAASCRFFEVCYDNGSGNRLEFTTFRYISSVGESRTRRINNDTCLDIALLVNESGDPVYANFDDPSGGFIIPGEYC